MRLSNAGTFRAMAYAEDRMLAAVMPRLAKQERVPVLRATLGEVAGKVVVLPALKAEGGER